MDNLDCVWNDCTCRNLWFVKNNRGDWMILGKKGEVTTKMIVWTIILVASFVVILIFIMQLDLRGTTQKEICHNSVVLMSKNPLKLKQTFDCSTYYVCISGGGDCEKFAYDEKVEIDAEDKDEIINAIADEVADCWWMFGEGKLDIGSFWDFKGVHCPICTTIKFDEKLEEEKISSSELKAYILKNKNLEIREINYVDILTSDKYSVLIGINNKKGVEDYLKPILAKQGDFGKAKTGCEKFDVTKV